MQYSTRLAVGAAALLLFVGCSAKKELPPGMQTMETRLQTIVAGKADAADLTVVYDDGDAPDGVKLTMSGNGKVEREGHLPKAPETRNQLHDLTPEQVRVLAKLLVDIQAWEQQTSDHVPAPDETRATLTIHLGAMESQIWEWHTDVAAQNRIGKVRQAIEESAS
ncbi:MAG TPA: hypothetical protein PKV72_03605 [Candidatus Peribacteria bacterium]|nr:hypothetical protein [Candidatus Peribacteria bacterium]